MTKENVKDLHSKIIQGIDLAYNRLLIAKQKEDGELVISQDDKIFRVKARDLTYTGHNRIDGSASAN
jgi:hypothetical protein